MGRPCLLLTFDPHPAEVVRPGSHPAILTSLDRKAELVASLLDNEGGGLVDESLSADELRGLLDD